MTKQRMSTPTTMAKTFRPGEILLANYPFTDHSSQKLRPVLVVSLPEFNSGADLVVVPISSQVKLNDRHAVNIMDDHQEFGKTGLRGSSAVKWTKLLCVSCSVVERSHGTMPQEIADQVYTKIKSMIP